MMNDELFLSPTELTGHVDIFRNREVPACWKFPRSSNEVSEIYISSHLLTVFRGQAQIQAFIVILHR